jgi:hypothetical protein
MIEWRAEISYSLTLATNAVSLVLFSARLRNVEVFK